MHYRMLLVSLFVATILPLAVQADQPSPAPRGLDMYFIDVEGGAAELIVTPTGESVLIDCGNPGGRDGERIHRVATEFAKLKAIDHLIITHWHIDHQGGVGRLSQLMPIHNYYDRGIPDRLPEGGQDFEHLIQVYKTASNGKSTRLKPGDQLPLKQKEGEPSVRLLCLCGSGEVIPDKPEAKENPIAKEHKPKAVDTTDNGQSLGFLLSYGGFRYLNLGDLTWNFEYKLVYPTDKVGLVDVFQASHHGLALSNNPVLINTVKPRVAVFSNGAHKGCEPSVTATLRRGPDIQAIYQLHRNLNAEAQENTDPEYIANAEEKCQGESIKLAVAPDGKSYEITVGSKGKPRRYETRSKQ